MPDKDQLVFPTDSITNQHVFMLGILSVTKTATQHGKLSLAQFPHKTLQEYAAGGHVAAEYIEGRTEAWEKVKMIFSQLFKSTERNSYPYKGETNRSFHPPYTEEQQKNIITATKKCMEAIMDNPRGRVAAIKKLAKVFLDKGFYDEDPDIPTLRGVAESLREAKDMTKDEFDALFEFVIEILSLADRKQKKMIQRAKRVCNSSIHASKYALILWLMINWMEKKPDEAIEVLSSTLLTSMSSTVMISSKAVTRQVQWLQDQANSAKILFRFILGKLTRHRQLAEEILKEIAELLLEHAFDSSSGEVLPIHFIQQYLLDLMSDEAGLSHQFPTSTLYCSEMEFPPDFTEAPLVVHINWHSSDKHVPDMTKAKALSAEEIGSNFQPTIDQMENMQSLMLMELHDIEDKALDGDYSKRLAKALSLTRLVSLALDNIQDTTLCTHLLQNLPSSLLM